MTRARRRPAVARRHHRRASGQLATRWKGIFATAGTNRRGVAVLDKGLEFKPIAVENDAAQLNETMKTLNTQICGAFRVRPGRPA